MDLLISDNGEALFRGRTYRCAIGRSGIRADKTEGDGASPAGRFELVQVLFRADRVDPPVTLLETAEIGVTDGWCDAPGDPNYNRPVALPYRTSCEAMYRDDALYDIVVVTSHNSGPVVPDAGSAIFVHLAGGPDFPATEGCVAFDAENLREILTRWTPGTDRLVIG